MMILLPTMMMIMKKVLVEINVPMVVGAVGVVEGVVGAPRANQAVAAAVQTTTLLIVPYLAALALQVDLQVVIKMKLLKRFLAWALHTEKKAMSHQPLVSVSHLARLFGPK
jgi:hypothetical protein